MSMRELCERVAGRYQRTVSGAFFRRSVPMANRTPIVSFSFDDFPRSAIQVAGPILRAHGTRGTYYTALGLMGRTESPVGRLFTLDDLMQVVNDGHELGCHTHAHGKRRRVFLSSPWSRTAPHLAACCRAPHFRRSPIRSVALGRTPSAA